MSARNATGGAGAVPQPGPYDYTTCEACGKDTQRIDTGQHPDPLPGLPCRGRTVCRLCLSLGVGRTFDQLLELRHPDYSDLPISERETLVPPAPVASPPVPDASQAVVGAGGGPTLIDARETMIKLFAGSVRSELNTLADSRPLGYSRRRWLEELEQGQDYPEQRSDCHCLGRVEAYAELLVGSPCDLTGLAEVVGWTP